ncbi:hypothetical protein pb186bvf_000308 [Paramecium bursaria]
MLCYLLIGLLLFVLFQVFGPLYHILRLKIKYGSRCIAMFFPLLGDLHFFKSNTLKYGDPIKPFQQTMTQSPYPQFRFSNLLNRTLVGINDPDYYKEILQDHQKFKKVYALFHQGLASNGLVFSDGETWYNQRKLLSSSFSFDQIIKRLTMMNEVVDTYINNFNQQNMVSNLQSMTSQIVSRSFLQNADISFLQDIPIIFARIGELRMNNPLWLFKHLLLGEIAWKVLPIKKETDILNKINVIKQKLDQVIQTRIQQRQQPSFIEPEIKDFLDIHLDQCFQQIQKNPNYKIDMDEIAQQFVTLYFAGTDTTAYGCLNVLLMLAEFPQYQEEIYEEVSSSAAEKYISRENIQQLIKLNAFIQESFRYRPSVPTLILRTVRQDMKIKDLELKKGWFVVIDYFVTRMSEQRIDNPNVFDYKRWIQQQNPYKDENGFSNIAFSGGARNCIGQHMAKMELTIIIAKILKQYKLQITKPVTWFIRGVVQSFTPEDALQFIKRE